MHASYPKGPCEFFHKLPYEGPDRNPVRTTPRAHPNPGAAPLRPRATPRFAELVAHSLPTTANFKSERLLSHGIG
jgi:hypothetical protein